MDFLRVVVGKDHVPIIDWLRLFILLQHDHTLSSSHTKTRDECTPGIMHPRIMIALIEKVEENCPRTEGVLIDLMEGYASSLACVEKSEPQAGLLDNR